MLDLIRPVKPQLDFYALVVALDPTPECRLTTPLQPAQIT